MPTFPQGLKPAFFSSICGTTEVVPCYTAGLWRNYCFGSGLAGLGNTKSNRRSFDSAEKRLAQDDSLQFLAGLFVLLGLRLF